MTEQGWSRRARQAPGLAEGAPVGQKRGGRTGGRRASRGALPHLDGRVRGGSSLVGSHFSGDSPATRTLLAGVLRVYSGLAVAGIGLAMPLLRPPTTSDWPAPISRSGSSSARRP